MRSLTPAILVFSLLTFDMSARSRVGVPASDAAAKPAEGHSIGTLNEIAIAPVSDDPEIRQSNPVIATDGESFLLVWREWSDPGNRVPQPSVGSLYAARLNRRGEPMDPAPTLISSTATSTRHAVAFDGTDYLLVWSELGPMGTSLVAQRFSREAIPIGSAPVLIRFNVNGEVGLACHLDECLAVFSQGYALIPRVGDVRINLDVSGSRNDVIPTPDRYVALVKRSIGKFPSIGVVPAAFEAHALVELQRGESEPHRVILITDYLSQAFEEISSTLATNGSSIVIAGVIAETAKPRQLFVTRLPSIWGEISASSNKTFVNTGMIDGQPPFVLDPNIVWSGRRYLLVYQETDEVRYAISIHQNWRNMSTSEIAGVWIEEDGSVGAPFRITSTDEIERDPALAAVEDGLIALAFVRGPDAIVKSRLFVRMMSDTVRTRRPARR